MYRRQTPHKLREIDTNVVYYAQPEYQQQSYSVTNSQNLNFNRTGFQTIDNPNYTSINSP